MTYLRFHKKSVNFKENPEKGVTLLMAILVLAAITAIVFSAASIAFNELRSSSDVTKTEPVITADEAMAEDSLFLSIRNLGSLASCSNPSSTTINGVVVSSCASYYFNNPYIFTLNVSNRKDFYLYNPFDQTQPPGYTSLSVQINSGFQSTVYFCDWNIVDCKAGPQIDVQTISASGPTTTWNSPVLDPNKLYILTIDNSAANNATYTVNSSPTGLPSGTTNIEHTGSKAGLTRKLEVDIPQ